ncbi:tetratricopeptide repeat protein [Nannocystaceae bacterium ST9]
MRTFSLRSAFGPLALGLVLAVSGCAGKQGGTASPRGKSKADVEAEKEKAAEIAKIQGLIELANADLGNGRYVSARKRAEEALAEDPNNADAYVVLGAAEWRAGEFESSTEAFRKAIEIDPKNFGAAIDLSRNLRAMSQYDEALKVLEPVIAAEGEGFASKACESLQDCVDAGGWCHPTEKVCKAPVQIQTRRAQLWGYYTTLDVDKGIHVAGEVFLGVAGDDDATKAILEVIRAYSDFLKLFEGKSLVEFEGETATINDFGLDAYTGVKHAFALVGGEPSRVAFSEVQIESRVSPEAVERLKLTSLGKIKVFGMGDEEFDVVLVPEIDFQGMKLKNIPAVVQDLSFYESGMGEIPAIVLGHQVLHRIGTMVADFPGGKLTLSKAAPTAAPAGATELPLLMLDQWYIHVPVTKIGLDGADFRFWAWIGGIHPSAVSTTAKTYLKSNHLPRDIENPEDPETGRKMVFVDHVAFGTSKVDGVGGLVFLDQPGDVGLDGVRDSNGLVGFEIGGYVNAALMKQLEVTYAFGQGKLWVRTP